MKVTCPKCGEVVISHSLGRHPLNIGVIEVCDALQRYGSALLASQKLGCSRPYLYKVLRASGLTMKEVLKK